MSPNKHWGNLFDKKFMWNQQRITIKNKLLTSKAAL